MEKIGVKRGEEVASVRAQAMMFALSGFLWLVTPVLVSTFSFALFCAFGGVLTAPRAFAALSLFSILRGPLSGLPRVLQLLVQVRAINTPKCVAVQQPSCSQCFCL
jgi:hypothetical protein